MNAFTFQRGTLPLLVTIPHASTRLTAEVEAGLTPRARLLADTDWHLPQLYQFVSALGVSVLVGNYSRLVVDLNRPADNQALYSSATTGLFPETLFDGSPTFLPGKTPTNAQRQHYMRTIWHPWHRQLGQELARIKAQFGYALLLDAHSIATRVPRLFNGPLPDFNWGTFNGASCSAAISQRLCALSAGQHSYSWVLNGRFKGGYITRAYGNPAENQHAVQLELAQHNYMQQLPPFHWRQDRAVKLQAVLKQVISTLLAAGAGA